MANFHSLNMHVHIGASGGPHPNVGAGIRMAGGAPGGAMVAGGTIAFGNQGNGAGANMFAGAPGFPGGQGAGIAIAAVIGMGDQGVNGVGFNLFGNNGTPFGQGQQGGSLQGQQGMPQFGQPGADNNGQMGNILKFLMQLALLKQVMNMLFGNNNGQDNNTNDPNDQGQQQPGLFQRMGHFLDRLFGNQQNQNAM